VVTASRREGVGDGSRAGSTEGSCQRSGGSWAGPPALCPLPTALCPLPPARCPLPTAPCPLPTAPCPLLAWRWRWRWRRSCRAGCWQRAGRSRSIWGAQDALACPGGLLGPVPSSPLARGQQLLGGSRLPASALAPGSLPGRAAGSEGRRLLPAAFCSQITAVIYSGAESRARGRALWVGGCSQPCSHAGGRTGSEDGSRRCFPPAHCSEWDPRGRRSAGSTEGASSVPTQRGCSTQPPAPAGTARASAAPAPCVARGLRAGTGDARRKRTLGINLPGATGLKLHPDCSGGGGGGGG